MLSPYEIANAVRNGETSTESVLGRALGRIDALEAGIQAWVALDREGAQARARELAAGAVSGALAGVPAGVKDIVDVAGFPTRCGAPAFAHRQPEANSTVARRLREAGAVILGKTHTTEFAYLDPAPTRNPWNQAHTPGGSSSGSAAAVAAGMAALAVGSQTVGSVLRPAGYCGITGFKPAYGRISCAGVFPLAPSFDHLGLLVPRVRDAALGLSALAGHDPADPNSLDAPVEDFVAAIAEPRAPRLGIPRGYFAAVAEAENLAHLEAVASRLAEAGATIAEVGFPAPAPEIADLAMPVMRYEAARSHAALYAHNREAYRPNIKALIEAGLEITDAAYDAARADVGALREGMSAILEAVDAMLLPTAPGTAPAGLMTTGPGILCGPATFTGLPSIALPSGVAPNGLPFSVQLIGPPRGESKLLNVAAWVESVLDFQARPPLPAS